MILQRIYEQDFLDNSYGFRPHKNAHPALNDVDQTIMKKLANYLVEADIKGFFDNFSHEKLIDFSRLDTLMIIVSLNRVEEHRKGIFSVQCLQTYFCIMCWIHGSKTP